MGCENSNKKEATIAKTRVESLAKDDGNWMNNSLRDIFMDVADMNSMKEVEKMAFLDDANFLAGSKDWVQAKAKHKICVLQLQLQHLFLLLNPIQK